MFGVKSKSVCIKFHEDDPDQMAALNFLQNERGTRTYAEMITALVKGSEADGKEASMMNCEQVNELLTEIRHICMDLKDMMSGCAPSPTEMNEGTTANRSEKMAHKDEIPQGISDLMRQLSGEDEDE